MLDLQIYNIRNGTLVEPAQPLGACRRGMATTAEASTSTFGELVCSCSAANAAATHTSSTDMHRYSEYKQLYACPDLTYERFQQLELDEWNNQEPEDCSTSASEEYEEYESESGSDAPYSHICRNGENDREVGLSCSSDMECPDKADCEPATDIEMYDIEAATIAAVKAEWHSDSSEPESDPDTDDQGPVAALVGAAISGAASSMQPPKASAADADERSLQEIRHYQATVHNLTSFNGVKQLLESIMEEHHGGRKLTDKAVRALQVAAEDYVIKLFNDAQVMALHAGRQKVYPEDITAVRFARFSAATSGSDRACIVGQSGPGYGHERIIAERIVLDRP